MTCQHCQTWMLDEDHRCRRCGRRIRNVPPRISPSTYPIAATATALALDYSAVPSHFTDPEIVSAAAPPSPQGRQAVPHPGEQQWLLSEQQRMALRRVISFDELTTAEERASIRARAANLPQRPSPVRTETVGVPHARPSKTRRVSSDQRHFEWSGEEQAVNPLRASVKCDAVVAPLSLRLQAALFDMIIMLVGCLVSFGVYYVAGGPLPHSKGASILFAVAMGTVPLLYRLLWTSVGQDSIGMQHFGLRLVDFDGNPPTSSQRFGRLGGSLLSLLAAGMGMIWAYSDPEHLTWHDHMSSTFPTVVED